MTHSVLSEASYIPPHPNKPEPPEQPRTPVQEAADRELGYRLEDVCQIARKAVGPLVSWGRAGERAWIVTWGPVLAKEAAEALTAAGFQSTTTDNRVLADLSSPDCDLDRLRREGAVERQERVGPVYRREDGSVW